MAAAKKTFPQSAEDFRNLLLSIEGKKYSNCYLLCGNEPYFIDRISARFSESVLSEEEKSFNQYIVYGQETTGLELTDLCRQYPVNSPYSVVIVRDAQDIRKPEPIVNYLNNPLKTTILVLCWNATPDKRTALYKAIDKHFTVFESAEPRDYEIQGWLTNHIRGRGIGIDSVAVELLVESLGTSLTKIENEIDKLLTGLPAGRKTISVQDIEERVGISKEYNNFELTKALSSYNIPKALAIVDYFGKNPAKNNYSATVAVLFTHFVRIFRLGLIQWESKKKKTPLPGQQELALQLKIGSTYFLKEYETALRHFPLAKLHTILGIIRTYEMKGKGVGGGSATDGELLKELIIRIISV